MCVGVSVGVGVLVGVLVGISRVVVSGCHRRGRTGLCVGVFVGVGVGVGRIGRGIGRRPRGLLAFWLVSVSWSASCV